MERALASKNVDSSDFHVRDIYYRVINGSTEFREKIIFFFFFIYFLNEYPCEKRAFKNTTR